MPTTLPSYAASPNHTSSSSSTLPDIEENTTFDSMDSFLSQVSYHAPFWSQLLLLATEEIICTVQDSYSDANPLQLLLLLPLPLLLLLFFSKFFVKLKN